MSGASVVRLGDVAGRIERLEVECARCPRRGLLRLARLIREQGSDLSFPALGNLLAAGCPNANGSYGKRCFVIFPQLRELAAKDQRDVPEGAVIARKPAPTGWFAVNRAISLNRPAQARRGFCGGVEWSALIVRGAAFHQPRPARAQ